MRSTAAITCLVLSLSAAPAAAIIMRHDVPEAEYRALGHQHRGVLVALGLRAESDGAPMLYSGMGTLIAPTWVLTAAHAAAPIVASGASAEHFVFVRGRGYKVARVVIHPAWTEAENDNDIALVQLQRPVENAVPACLQTTRDEAGQIATLVGQGLPGDGLRGPGDRDGILRGATVRVGTAEATTLSWVFRKPDDPLVTPLEGISGPGDSGGPALLPAGDTYCVAGVSSEQRIEIDPAAPPSGGGQGRYGVIEIYTRVSAYVPWIREVTGLR